MAPVAGGFDVLAADTVVRHCEDEFDAHHWAMHVFDAVNRGLDRPHAIQALLLHICLQRQRGGAHPPTPAALPSLDPAARARAARL
ncbi:MAG: hypothetical protein V3V06_08460 [Dehalococcoidia bacterium]